MSFIAWFEGRGWSDIPLARAFLAYHLSCMTRYARMEIPDPEELVAKRIMRRYGKALKELAR